MKQFIDKLIERLEEEKEGAKRRNAFDSELSYKRASEIVNQLAEEYAKDTNVQTIDVSELLGESEQVKQSNADRLRAMSDEELAEWLTKITDDAQLDARTKFNYQWADWLQSEAEEPYD